MTDLIPKDYAVLLNDIKLFQETYANNPKLAPMVREIGWSHNIIIMESKSNLQALEKSQTVSAKSETKFKELKINESRYVNNELKRTRTNSNCVSSFQFVPVRCLNYLRNRTRMTQIRRIFTDTFNPCASVSSVQSMFHPKNPNNYESVFIRVHPQLNESNQSPQKAQSIATIIFASFELFAVRFINSLNELSSIAQPSVFIGVHPRLIYRTAPAEG